MRRLYIICLILFSSTFVNGLTWNQCLNNEGPCKQCIDICKSRCINSFCEQGCENMCNCEGSKCQIPTGILKSHEEVGAVVGKRRRKREEETLFLEYDPKYAWYQDTDGHKDKKKRKCCLTTKRTIPFTTPIEEFVWPVYCPLSGGYQWIDQVKCQVTRTNREETAFNGWAYPSSLSVDFASRQMCPNVCQAGCTKRTYLVTNAEPNVIFGHCIYQFYPVWFQDVIVDTHCYCSSDEKRVRNCE